MNQVLHKIIFLVFGALLIHLSSYESEAAVYKWKDGSGKIHFTDNPNRVPEEFRKEHFKKKLPPPIHKSKIPIKIEEKSDSQKKGVDSENEKDTKNEELKKEEGLTAEEKSAAEAVIAFFEKDISRYDEIYKIPPGYRNNGIRKWKTLKRTVAATIPQKKALIGQISVSERPLFKEMTLFLKKTIEFDEEISTYGALISKNTRKRVNKLSSRLNAQAASEKKFLDRLKEALTGPGDPEKNNISQNKNSFIDSLPPNLVIYTSSFHLTFMNNFLSVIQFPRF
jgi:hypothetical protein